MVSHPLSVEDYKLHAHAASDAVEGTIEVAKIAKGNADFMLLCAVLNLPRARKDLLTVRAVVRARNRPHAG